MGRPLAMAYRAGHMPHRPIWLAVRGCATSPPCGPYGPLGRLGLLTGQSWAGNHGGPWHPWAATDLLRTHRARGAKDPRRREASCHVQGLKSMGSGRPMAY
jgi:hypothetical protein